jgi:mannonate dehydratase
MRKIFKNIPESKGGYFYPIEDIGIGVGFDESLAEEFPPIYRAHEWTQSRIPDGTLIAP